jgi:hypothetical protein
MAPQGERNNSCDFWPNMVTIIKSLSALVSVTGIPILVGPMETSIR